MIKATINQESKSEFRVNFNLIKKSRSCEKCQIWLTTTINNERARVYTGLRIEPQFWDKKSRKQKGGRAFEDGNFSQAQKCENKKINARLKEILGFCKEYLSSVSESDLQNEAIPYSKNNFESYIAQKLRGEEASIRKSAIEFINDYIRRKASMVNKTTQRTIAKGTIYNHKNALNRLQLFCDEKHKRVVWELFDKRFADNFIAWMNSKNYSANTIATQFSIMKVWLSDAEFEGLICDKYFHKYPTKTHDVENVYLTEDEIQRIYNIDFSNEEIKQQIDPHSHIEQVRDLFVIACWTGLRFGDWKELSNIPIKGNRIYLTTHKTNEKVVIPVLPIVKEILEKYKGQLPSNIDKSKTIKHIRKCAELAHIDAPITQHRIKGGKDVVLNEPKYKFISNHTARRSFCTNMYLRKIPIKAIMSISGHTTETNFFKYIKIDKEQYADMVEESFEKC